MTKIAIYKTPDKGHCNVLDTHFFISALTFSIREEPKISTLEFRYQIKPDALTR